MNLGPAEILVILVVALIVFGPKRLPEVGRQVGSAMRELRKMQDTVRAELDPVLHPDLSPSDVTTTPDDDAPEEPDHTALPSASPHVLDAGDTDEGFPSPGSFN